MPKRKLEKSPDGFDGLRGLQAVKIMFALSKDERILVGEMSQQIHQIATLAGWKPGVVFCNVLQRGFRELADDLLKDGAFRAECKRCGMEIRPWPARPAGKTA